MGRIYRRIRGGRWVAGAAFLVLLTACQDPDPFVEAQEIPETTTTEAARTTTTARETTTTTTELESRTGAPGWQGDVDQISGEQNVSDDIATLTRPISFETAVSFGRDITITFPGGLPGDSESLCNTDHRVDVSENDEEVVVRVTQLLILVPDAALRDCQPSEQDWAVTSTLRAPIGDRVLVDRIAGSAVFVAQHEARLEPTWLPDGWVRIRDSNTVPLRTVRYASPDGMEILVFQSAPISAGYRLTDHSDDIGWEPTTVRNPEDGVFLSLEDRRTSVTFEEQGWYYKVNSTPGVDPADVLNVARSFERPALVEGELDPRLTPIDTRYWQPGQEVEAEPQPGEDG